MHFEFKPTILAFAGTRACADRVRNPTPQGMTHSLHAIYFNMNFSLCLLSFSVASLSLPQGQGQHSPTLNPGSASDHFDNVYRAHLEKDD